MNVFIHTESLQGIKGCSNKNINWNDSSDRKWLMNHLHWAMNNGHRVSLEPRATPVRFGSSESN